MFTAVKGLADGISLGTLLTLKVEKSANISVRTQTNGVHKRTTFNLVLENVNRIKAS